MFPSSSLQRFGKQGEKAGVFHVSLYHIWTIELSPRVTQVYCLGCGYGAVSSIALHSVSIQHTHNPMPSRSRDGCRPFLQDANNFSKPPGPRKVAPHRPFEVRKYRACVWFSYPTYATLVSSMCIACHVPPPFDIRILTVRFATCFI